MPGSDPGAVSRGVRPYYGPWGQPPAAERGRPSVRERVFRVSLLGQFREGAWPYAFGVVLPGLGLLVALVASQLSEETHAGWALVVGILLMVAVGRLLGSLGKAMKPHTEDTSTCGWIALGDGYIRLGMSFLRPRILLQQIVDVERGFVHRGRWLPETQAAEILLSEREAPRLKASANLGRQRVRVRLVMRRSWEVRAFAYPASIDPLGELTTHLTLAGHRTRNHMRIPDGAPDEVVAVPFKQLADRVAQYAETREQAAEAAEEMLVGPARGARGWVPPTPDRLPETELPAPIAPAPTPAVPLPSAAALPAPGAVPPTSPRAEPTPAAPTDQSGGDRYPSPAS